MNNWNYLYKFIYLLGIYCHNQKIFEKYDFLKKSQGWTRNEINDWQVKSCKKLLNHAYNHSPFYNKIFNEYEFKVDEFEKLDNLRKLPIISKDDLLNNRHDIQNFLPSEKHFYSETSGTSGFPLVFYRNATWEAYHNASVMRGYSWHSVSPWERNGYLWGYNFSFKRKLKTQFLDFLQNRFRLFTYDDNEIESFAKKLENASFLGGYSSMIYEISKYLNQSKLKHNFQLKLIKGTSEKIFPLYKKEILKAFGTPIISEYGSAEAGIIAFECPHGSQHINMETVIVERCEGQIIVTNLFSHSFPIIRYRLGDFINLSYGQDCVCGVKHASIDEIIGRVGNVIYGINERYPSLTLYYVFKNLASDKNIILNYQAIQNEKGKLTVLIEQNKSDKIDFYLKYELNKYFKNDIEISLFYNELLKSSQRKKIDFISTISL